MAGCKGSRRTRTTGIDAGAAVQVRATCGHPLAVLPVGAACSCRAGVRVRLRRFGTSIFLAASAPAHRFEGAEQDSDKQDLEQPPQHVHTKEMIAVVHIEYEMDPCQLDWKASFCRSAWLNDARDLTVRRCAWMSHFPYFIKVR